VDGGKPEWVELCRLSRPRHVRALVRRLEREGIETRTTVGTVADRNGLPAAAHVILVPRVEIDNARFVLVSISFEGPSTAELAAGAARWRRRVAAAVAAGACLLALVLHSVPMSIPKQGCRTGAPASEPVCAARATP
jgi:hypothetical protein